MISWDHFIYFATPSVALWSLGAWFAFKNKRVTAYTTTAFGLVVFLGFIVLLWSSLERPPLRTMGETRLWYSFFVVLTGLLVYSRWKYRWILTFSTVLSLVFICVNLFNPELHSKTLMPALQSAWFVPHVIVYMFAYAVLGASAVMALYLLVFRKGVIRDEELGITDNLVYVGLSFLTFGMLFGALWAKEAWGHYWSWDPKETWAAITWLAYLVYVHYRRILGHRPRRALVVLLISFILLQMCWWGINYLPSAQETSVHTYGGVEINV